MLQQNSASAHVKQRQPTGTVAIVVPLSMKPTLTADEEISLRHLNAVLGRYDKYFVMGRSLRFDRPGFESIHFPDRYFGSARAHARLQLAEEFYATFQSYKYILMYHLDALAFSDQLMEWCATDLDFVGAPWLPCADSPWVKRPRVGNSGFALMKVESFLNVMRSRRRAVDPDEYWRHFCASRPRHVQIVNAPRKYLKRLRLFNGVRWEMRKWPDRAVSAGSDHFWSDRAVAYYPEFKVASVETGLRFAFEVAPRLCFEMIGQQLPFGCHAWPVYDRQFWEPHLLQ
jgi:Protein of unknown function (DUF5672)